MNKEIENHNEKIYEWFDKLLAQMNDPILFSDFEIGTPFFYAKFWFHKSKLSVIEDLFNSMGISFDYRLSEQDYFFECNEDPILETLINKEYLVKGINYRNDLRKINKARTPFTKSIRHEVFKRDNYKCVECGATKENTVLHIDHIIPVSQGGTDELDNLQTLCETCNLAKSNRKWKWGI